MCNIDDAAQSCYNSSMSENFKKFNYSGSQIIWPCAPSNFDDGKCPNRTATCKLKDSEDSCPEWQEYQKKKKEEALEKSRLRAGESAITDMFRKRSNRVQKEIARKYPNRR